MLRNLLGGVWYAAIGTVAILAVLLLNVALPDKADASPWTGCGVVVTGSLDSAVLEDILGANGYGISGGVLCDRKWDRVVLGVFANYGIGRFDWASIDIDTQGWQGGGRAGVTLTDTTLVYVLAAYEELNAEVAGFDVDLTGPVLGGGVEIALWPGWAGRLEYQRAMLETEGLGDAEVNIDRIRAGLVWKLNFDPITAPFESKPLK